MTMRERESLVARIRQLRRARPDTARPSPAATDHPADARLESLEHRIADLEHLVQGLQDSVHRETMRHGKLIAELQAQIEPGAMNAALSKDARERGL